MLKIVLYASLSLAAMALTGSLGGAQQATFKRTELQRGDLSISGREAVQTLAEIPSGVASGRHTHPGQEVGYILEGTVVMEIEGKQPVTLKAGDVFYEAPGAIHSTSASASPDRPAKILAIIIGEKGKQVTTYEP